MKIAIGQIDILAGSVAKNLHAMLNMISQAKAAGAEAIFFPAYSGTGFYSQELLQNNAFLSECDEAVRLIRDAAENIHVIFSMPDMDNEHMRHKLFLAENGEIQLLAACDISLTGLSAEMAGKPVFTTLHSGQQKLHLALIWQNDLTDLTYEADLVVDMRAKPFYAEGGTPHNALGIPFLQINCCGLQNSGKTNYLFAGGSYLQAADETILAQAPYFEEGLFIWDSLLGGDIVPIPRLLFKQALVDGVRRFTKAIYADRAVIGISGGIDSAVSAGLYAAALGPENVLLVSMPSRFNSDVTKSLAERMANGLGTNFALLSIENSVNDLFGVLRSPGYKNHDGQNLPLELTPLGQENVQARERLRYLAAAAASFGGIFTCNANKTEATVGYSTFYGDLGGAFASQGDLWKYQVYQAAEELQQCFPDAPFREIASIRPSAELSANQDVTKGMGDPLCYPYHDHLLRSWVEKKDDLSDTLAAYKDGTLAKRIGCEPHLPKELFPDAVAFINDCERWWKCYRGLGVAKRIQAPPLLAMSPYPFGESFAQAQGQVYFSRTYLQMKEEILSHA